MVYKIVADVVSRGATDVLLLKKTKSRATAANWVVFFFPPHLMRSLFIYLFMVFFLRETGKILSEKHNG